MTNSTSRVTPSLLPRAKEFSISTRSLEIRQTCIYFLWQYFLNQTSRLPKFHLVKSSSFLNSHSAAAAIHGRSIFECINFLKKISQKCDCLIWDSAFFLTLTVVWSHMIKRVMLRKVKEALQVEGKPQDLAQLHESHLGVVLKTFRCLLYPKHRAPQQIWSLALGVCLVSHNWLSPAHTSF